MPKSKSVEFKKIYNFAFRVSFKRIRVLKLFQNLTNYQISHKTYLKLTFQLKPYGDSTSYNGLKVNSCLYKTNPHTN
jgi:hypothetical protein